MSSTAVITIGLNPTFDRILEVPGFAVGQHAKARLRSRRPSGKALNVSRALALLGVPSTATGFVGLEAEGEFDRAARSAGITPAFITVDRRTRENTTIIDPVNHTETHLREQGPLIAPRDIERLRDSIRDLVQPNAIVVLTGSLPPGVVAEDFGRILDECAARGGRLVVDTSGPALRAATARDLWLVKPNREELAELIGREASDEADLIEQAKALRPSGGAMLLSAGEQGAYLITVEAAWHAQLPLPPAEIRSTVGCGDALLGGFLAASLNEGRVSEAALRHAVAVAAASALNDLPAAFSLDDVRALLPRVQLNHC